MVSLLFLGLVVLFIHFGLCSPALLDFLGCWMLFYCSFIFTRGELYWWVLAADMCGSASRSSLFWRGLAAVCVVGGTHQHKRSPCRSPEQSNLTLGMQSFSLLYAFSVSPPLVFRYCFPSVSLLEVQVHLKLGFFLRSQHPCHTFLLPL